MSLCAVEVFIGYIRHIINKLNVIIWSEVDSQTHVSSGNNIVVSFVHLSYLLTNKKVIIIITMRLLGERGLHWSQFRVSPLKKETWSKPKLARPCSLKLDPLVFLTNCKPTRVKQKQPLKRHVRRTVWVSVAAGINIQVLLLIIIIIITVILKELPFKHWCSEVYLQVLAWVSKLNLQIDLISEVFGSKSSGCLCQFLLQIKRLEDCCPVALVSSPLRRVCCCRLCGILFKILERIHLWVWVLSAPWMEGTISCTSRP